MNSVNRRAALSEQEPQSAREPISQLSRTRYLFWFIRTTACGILLALGLALLIQQVMQISQQPSDFCQEYIAAQRLAQGAPIYQLLRDSTSYSHCPLLMTYDAHPPPSVLLAYPLGFLPYVPASLIWGLCTLAAFLASGFLLLRALGWLRLAGAALFVIASAYWQPVVGAEGAQNLWQFLALLIVLAWLLERRGRAGWSGGLLGAAALLKLWPVLFLLGGLARRKFRLALVGALTILLGTALALGVMGPGAYAAYLGPVQASEASVVPVNGNISLVGAVARLFVGEPPLLGPVVPGFSLQTAILFGEGAAGALLIGALALIGWQRWRSAGEATDVLCQGLLVTVALLVFPLTWYFGLLLLLLPGATIILALRQLPRPPRWWFALLALSLLPFLAPYSLLALGTWFLEQHSAVGGWLGMSAFSLPTIGLLCFAAAQSYLLQYARAQRSASGS